MKLTKLALPFACVLVLLFTVPHAMAWSNGGYSANPSQPDYGTHDWIAQHALDYLPANEKQYILDNLASYLFGTERPDLPSTQGGIGDNTKHHIYFNADGTMYDDASAQRATEEYQKVLTFLENNDFVNASRTAGTMSHYIVDVAVFGHVMGSSTPWGTEVNHQNYEPYVDDRTGSFTSATFDSFLHFDGDLTVISAFNATVSIANNTTFDGGGIYNCTWMDANYDWSNTAFSSRAGESLNLAVNTLADVLHSLYLEANPPVTPTPTPTVTPSPTPSPTPTLSPIVSPSLTPTHTTQPVIPEYTTIILVIITFLSGVVLIATLLLKKSNKRSSGSKIRR